MQLAHFANIQADSLSFCYGTSQVLENLNFDWPVASRVLIAGNNGSGKTTLLSLLAGRRKPSSGKLCIGPTLLPSNDDASVLPYYVSTSERQFIPFMTIGENFEFIRSLKGVNKSEFNQRAKALFLEFNQFEPLLKKNYDRLSTGQKHFMLLALSLLLAPKVLLWDEPFRSIDAETASRLMKHQASCHASATLIIATPQTDDFSNCNFRYKLENHELIPL